MKTDEIQELKETHRRHVRVLKEEIEKERDEKIEWKVKYNRIVEAARAIGASGAVITHLEEQVQIRDTYINVLEKKLSRYHWHHQKKPRSKG